MWATSHDDSTLVSYCGTALTALGGSTSITFADGCISTKVRARAGRRDIVSRVSIYIDIYVRETRSVTIFQVPNIGGGP